VIFILEPSELAKAAIGKRVTVVDYPDGRLSIRYHDVELAYRTFDKTRQVDQGAIVDNKRLGPLLASDAGQSLPDRTASAASEVRRWLPLVRLRRLQIGLSPRRHDYTPE
jgi:hypothetical protein